MKPLIAILLSFPLVVPTLACGSATAENPHVWEKVEIVLEAEGTYANPYADVEVWVDLNGPGFERRCYGFWDGGKTFKVRVLATAPGEWSWTSGSNPPDAGLAGKSGSFTAVPWSSAGKAANPNRRGMIRNTANGHAFEYADGEPFFLMGDTWWATPTFRFPWYDDDRERPLGPEAGFKDYVRFRKAQGYNCVGMIAVFPTWDYDDKPQRHTMEDGIVLRYAWQQHDGGSEPRAKSMHDEDGNRPFLFPGKVPDYEKYVPDFERINPEYFQNLDRKIDYLNDQGFVPFIEVARRDVGQVWKKYYPWPESYVRYVQYVFSRYQANICMLSPIHFDTPAQSIPVEDWNGAANRVVEKYGHPPFGTPLGTNSNPSSLRNYGHMDEAKWLTYHQIGNKRTHSCYQYLTEIFFKEPCVPGFNGEPYYDGMLEAAPGSELAALYCRSAMYGSFLSGGFAGHIYGAGGWQGGIWAGDVEPAAPDPIWEAMQWASGDDMRHLKTFVFRDGRKYQSLVPSTDALTPNKFTEEDGNVGWCYAAATEDRSLILLYFERDCGTTVYTAAAPDTAYTAEWFDPREGTWQDAQQLTADGQGRIEIPPFPGGAVAKEDWAMRLATGR